MLAHARRVCHRGGMKRLSVEELSAIMQRMLHATTPEEKRRLKQEYASGFYGEHVDLPPEKAGEMLDPLEREFFSKPATVTDAELEESRRLHAARSCREVGELEFLWGDGVGNVCAVPTRMIQADGTIHHTYVLEGFASRNCGMNESGGSHLFPRQPLEYVPLEKSAKIQKIARKLTAWGWAFTYAPRLKHLAPE